MRRNSFFSCCTALFLIIALPAQAAKVEEVVTPSGLKAWLIEEHSLPLVAVKMVFRDAGAAYDPAGAEGRMSLTARMLSEGAGELDADAFQRAMENNAIQLGFGGDRDFFRASMETLSEKREEAFRLLGLALSQPRFDADALERVRAEALSDLKRVEARPHYKLERRLAALLYGDHPYAKPLAGSMEGIQSINAETLKSYTSHYLTRQNVIIAVVGDITKEELSRLMETHLSALPARYQADATVPEFAIANQAREEVIDHDIPQTMINATLLGLKRRDPRYFDALVLNEVLGGGGTLTSLLGEAIREKRGLAYSVSSDLEPMEKAAAWDFSFATRNEKAREAVDVLKSELKNVAEKGVDAAALKDAKDYLTGSFVLSLDSNSDLANFLIAMQLYDLGPDYLEKRNGYVTAVTKEKVDRLAHEMLQADKLTVVMVGKPAAGSK